MDKSEIEYNAEMSIRAVKEGIEICNHRAEIKGEDGLNLKTMSFRIVLTVQKTWWWLMVQAAENDKVDKWGLYWWDIMLESDHKYQFNEKWCNYSHMKALMGAIYTKCMDNGLSVTELRVKGGYKSKEYSEFTEMESDSAFSVCDKCFKAFNSTMDHGERLCDGCAIRMGLATCKACGKAVDDRVNYFGLNHGYGDMIDIGDLCDKHRASLVKYVKGKCKYVPSDNDDRRVAGRWSWVHLEGEWGVHPTGEHLKQWMALMMKNFAKKMENGRLASFCEYGDCISYAKVTVHGKNCCTRHGKAIQNGTN